MTREAAMRAALEKLLHAYEMLMPGIAFISVADYGLINEAPIEARKALYGELEPKRPWVTRCLQCGMSPRNSVHKNKRQHGYHTVQLGEHLTTEELINALKKQTVR